MVRRRLSLPFTDVKEDDEVVTDEETNNWKWKSYHEIDVKQNMGNGRYIHKLIQSNYNAKIMPIYFLDNYGGSADQLVIKVTFIGYEPFLYCGFCNLFDKYHEHGHDEDPPDFDPFDGYPSGYETD